MKQNNLIKSITIMEKKRIGQIIHLILYSLLILLIPFAIYNQFASAEYYQQHLQDGCNKLEVTCQSVQINQTECNYYVNGTLFCQRSQPCVDRTFQCYPKGKDITHCHLPESCVNHDNQINEICGYINVVLFIGFWLFSIYMSISNGRSLYRYWQRSKEPGLLTHYEEL